MFPFFSDFLKNDFNRHNIWYDFLRWITLSFLPTAWCSTVFRQGSRRPGPSMILPPAHRWQRRRRHGSLSRWPMSWRSSGRGRSCAIRRRAVRPRSRRRCGSIWLRAVSQLWMRTFWSSTAASRASTSSARRLSARTRSCSQRAPAIRPRCIVSSAPVRGW